MVYNLTVDVDYNENCEFNSSKTKTIFQIDEQNTNCTLEIYKDDNQVSNITIGDKIKFKATVQSNNRTVKIGAFQIYRVIETIGENNQVIYKDIPISEEQYKVNNEGNVVVEYQPTVTDTLTFKAIYTDSHNLFAESYAETTLTVRRIGTTTTFIPNKNEYIVNKKEKAQLTVQVTTEDGPLNYGRVTFLYYENPNEPIEADRKAHVIGNPVFVNEEGIATISYIPEQEFQSNDGDSIQYHKYYEDIFAVYNYNNDDFGDYWNFYGESRANKRVFVRGNISIELYHNNEPLERYPYKWSHIQEGKTISAKITVYDNDDEETVFSKNDEIQVHVKGTRVTAKQPIYTQYNTTQQYVEDNFNFIDFTSQTIQAAYSEEQECFYIENLNDLELSPGYYMLYADFSSQPTTENIENYVQSIDDSVVYYLQIDYAKQSNINISIDENYYITLDPIQIPSLIATVNNIDKLTGASCYYYIPKISSKKIEGMFFTENNTLKIKPKEDIIIYTAGSYTGYVTIPGGIYDNKEIPTLYSNQFTIKASSDITPTINIKNISNYPGVVRYRLNMSGIVDDTIEAQIYIDNEEQITTQQFDSSVQYFEGTFNELTVGEHTITTKATIQGKLKTVTKTFTVDKSIIDYEITPETKNLPVDPTRNVVLKLSCTGNNFDEINIDDIQVTINDNNVDREIELINENKNCMISFPSTVITDGNHTVKVYYNDSNFETKNKEVKFTTNFVAPKYDIELNNDNEENPTYIITLTNHYLDVIPVHINIDDTIKDTKITDDNGQIKLKYSDWSEEEDMNSWLHFENISLYINPNEDVEYNDNRLIAQKERYGVWFTYFTESTKEYVLRG